MRILAAPPFRTGSIAWQEQPGQWTLTVVCKATYALEPNVAPVAREPEDVVEHDNHWDDDPQKSVYAPSDLAPLKPAPEVLVVGSAFAPRGEPIRSVLARVVVGEVDKTVEVFLGQRELAPDGSVREGPWGTHMPLRYERAARGAEGQNPVGVHAEEVHGRHLLPNLEPRGAAASGGAHIAVPIGFGPIAWTWPERREKLRARAASWSDERWAEEALGDDFDPTFFQAAPADQRLAALRADEPIVLENLHPSHARLVTRLPGLVPRARVEAEGSAPWELTLVADTLWIDTNRGICTLTWRGQVPLDGRFQAGVVLIGAEEPSAPPRWPSRSPAAPPHFEEAPSEPGGELERTMIEEEAARVVLSAVAPVLPFSGRSSPLAAPAPHRETLPVLLAPEDEGVGGTSLVAVPVSGAAPAWLPVAPAPPPSAPVAAAPPTASAMPAPPPPPPPPPPLVSFPDPAPARKVHTLVSGASAVVPRSSPVSALDASNAAADSPARPSQRAASVAVEAAAAPPRMLVELIWYDPAKIAALRDVLAWNPLLAQAASAPAAPRPPDTRPDDEAAAAARAAEEKASRERADVRAVLGRAAPVSRVEAALIEAVSEDGGLTAPLVLCAGELELGLDEVKTLEALLGAAAAFASSDRKLKEAVDLASEMMKTPLGASPTVAAGFIAQVRDAWAKSSRKLPADYLDVHASRLLLEQRAYQMRGLWDDTYIRAVLVPDNDAARRGIPTYLPASLAKRLPLFARFPARVVAEAFPQQDQLETCPVALRATALGRVVDGRALR